MMNTVFIKVTKKCSFQNNYGLMCLLILVVTFFAMSALAQENKQTAGSMPVAESPSKIEKNSNIPSYFPTTTQTTPIKRNIGMRDFLSSFLFLALIVMLIFLLAWLFKRSGLSPTSGNQIIKIVSAIPLGQKEKIALIEVGNQQVLVGISPGNIQKLLILDSPVKVDEKALKTSSVPFSTQLFNSLNKEKNAN